MAYPQHPHSQYSRDDYNSPYAHYPQHHHPPPPRDYLPDGHYYVNDPYPPQTASRPSPYPMLHKDATGGSYASEFSDAAPSERTFPIAAPDHPPDPPPDAPGLLRTLLPDSTACRLYLLVVLVETIVDIAIESDVLFLVENNTPMDQSLKVTRLPTYLVVFGLAHLFQLLLALDAVHARNTLQFIFLAIFNLLLMMESLIQKTEILEAVPSSLTGVSHIPVSVLTTIVPLVIGVAEIAYVALGWKIYTEFGWSVYKRLGADRRVKRMYMHFQIFICLVKFDVFFWLGFSVQWLFLVLRAQTTTAEYYITVAALPFCLLLLLCGHLAAKHERKWLMVLFMVGCVAAFIYFSYKLYEIVRFRQEEALRPVFKTLTVFSALAVVLIVITFIWACIVLKNFGHGLRTRVEASHKKGASSVHLARNKTLRMSHFELGSTRRLSID